MFYFVIFESKLKLSVLIVHDLYTENMSVEVTFEGHYYAKIRSNGR